MARYVVSCALSGRLGHEATDDLLELVESARTEWTEHVMTLAEARFERRLTQEISALRVDVTRELHQGLATVRQEIATVRVELIR
ncbi:MAG: hypothetical protein EXQ59_04480 [Acidobacteria bacterium]|nr:hypothetical protein [Acidobacteriota bacterium]